MKLLLIYVVKYKDISGSTKIKNRQAKEDINNLLVFDEAEMAEISLLMTPAKKLKTNTYGSKQM
jgi:hypothetical protein